MSPPSAPRRAPRQLVLGLLWVAAALAACGGEDGAGPASEPQPPTDEATPEAPGGRPGGEAAPGPGDRERQPEGGEPEPPDTSPRGCAFTAPEGRLAEATVAIDLDGVPCGLGTRLARAAALGQPAGANLTIDTGGYRCVPSTARKGANVTYTCSGDAGSARFDVVWSAGR